ncbi:hypothetical protein Ddye_018175 [Dipteronia dyeriana]|uniref:SBP-type domain-containing protein n=1 Tax=Dipteronia dyeriana TaxID=168575 RepID=A0AAD9X175_9ROSI|nr:hypothetical protein Ddye_018175 [Dipteronia dyeriana]
MENGNNSNNLSFDNMWTINHSRFDWGNSSTSSLYDAAAAAATATTTTADTNSATNAHSEASAAHHALVMFPHSLNHHHLHHHHHHRQQSLYGGDGSNLHPDPHLMCLKLGKRHYFEDCSAPISDRHVGSFSLVKRGKTYYSCGGASTDAGGSVGVGVAPSPSLSSPSVLGTPASVPRCQVEGCHVALINAKDYHRRHKVCEMHSKAPKVVVLGLEQRFCQQCSRFHVVSEFDDSKRSCRRRLAGHNERRRKSSHDSVSRNSSQVNELMTGRFPYIASPTGRALSLLSSKASGAGAAADSWFSASDLSSRCSDALRELIVENRTATILARHYVVDQQADHYWHSSHYVMDHAGDQCHEQTDDQTGHGSNPLISHHHQTQMQLMTEPHCWARLQETSCNNTHVTLDLMQAPSGQFELLSLKGKAKQEEEEECSELWNSFEGSGHVG